MSKRTNGWKEEKIARYYAEGRGKGELASYKPWLTIQNVPSSGRVHRFKGWKTNRIYHFLSDLERDYCYLLDWSEDVIDIREQFPLDQEKTIQIAEDKQINHSVDPTTRTPIVMTTDFLMTVRRDNEIKYLARTVKPSGELNDN
ncbi:transposase [Domibacillus aminovorans]|uniref:Transposase n=1 Tax=Domibacillus aminovorans TaxID=29332 RepID=A0A177KY78_9BACI|nr:TnsA endonuclease N-terminal domain-containing protein [Domibacillus aminovorans]OAH57955.1 transposase [Domibacillus aminovorans]